MVQEAEEPIDQNVKKGGRKWEGKGGKKKKSRVGCALGELNGGCYLSLPLMTRTKYLLTCRHYIYLTRASCWSMKEYDFPGLSQ